MTVQTTSSAPVWHIRSFHELTTTELYNILQLRTDVFVVEQNCPYADTDGEDVHALHLWAEMDGLVVACCRIFPAGIKYELPSIGRVATHRQHRALGLGKILMHLAVNTSENRHRTAQIQISAQDYLLNFYKNFGFAPTGKKYLEDGIPHSEMVRGGNL